MSRHIEPIDLAAPDRFTWDDADELASANGGETIEISRDSS